MPYVLSALAAACASAAANLYQLPQPILPILLDLEGGTVGAVSRNTNGTVDIGPMQVNSHWVPKLAKRYGVGPDVVYSKLLNDECYNIHVGAWILKTEIELAKGDFWQGVGHYHSRTAVHKRKYMQNAVRAAVKRFGDGIFQTSNQPARAAAAEPASPASPYVHAVAAAPGRR